MKRRLIGINLAGFLLVVSSMVAPNMAALARPSDTPADAHAGLAVANQPTPTAPSSSSALPDGEQRYIVKYGEEVNAEAESQSLEQKGIEVKETLSHTMKASVVVATPQEMESLQKSDDVASIEVDTRVSVSGATSIWGIDRVDQRSGRDGQYSIGDEGAGVHVYVVDTGLNFSHTEFSGRVPTSWWGIHDGRAANDCNGHGTHVAGSVAGTIYGVAKKATIIPVRVVECDGSGWSSTAMAGIDWAVAHHAAGQPAVMNLSIGGFTNASFDQAVQGAVNDGITVVAAAGNDGVDACWAAPARVAPAITVAATNINDVQASWSNYGSCVDIQAPGVWIRSAWTNAPTGYNTLDGTSMAAPHVSGAAAILLSRDRSLSPAQVHQAMIQNATAGVVSANKGATPNRLLYIPAAATGPPSCHNLKPGDAWAGVGTHCGLQGSATSVPSIAEMAAGIDAPGSAALVGIDDPDSDPAPAPVTPEVAQSGPAETPAPVQDYAPLQHAAVPAPHAPAGGDAAPGVAAAEPEVISADDAADVATETGTFPVAPAPGTERDSSWVVAPGSGAVPQAVDVREDVQADRVVTGANNPAWLITFGVGLGGVGVAYAIRRLKLSRAETRAISTAD